MSIYRRVLRYYQPFRGKTIIGLFLSAVGIGLNLLKPWPFKIIVDDFLRPTPAARGDWSTWVPLLCLALVVIQFIWGIINWITNYLFVKIGLQALLKLRTDLYAHLQRLSLKFHDARRSADSSFRVAYDSQSIQTIYNKGFTNIFASVIALIGTFIVMLRLDWVLTLLSLAIVPLIVIAALTPRLWVDAVLLVVAVAIALLSSVPLGTLAKRVWLGVLTFTGFIALPALILTPGHAIYTVPFLGWTVTAQGLRAALFLIMRAETAATFSVLLVLCTPWSNVLKALRVLRLPVVLVVILGMTYRYIFLLLRNAHDMFTSRRSRMVGRLDGREQRRAATASAGVLMSKTLQLSGDVYLAMRSRGFQGEVYVLDEFQTGWFDWAMLALFLTLAAAAFWLGR